MAPTTEAFVYDALRTRRGRGRVGGSLNTVKPVDLLTGLIDALQERNPTLDPAYIEDLIIGVVSPVGDQGADPSAPEAAGGAL